MSYLAKKKKFEGFNKIKQIFHEKERKKSLFLLLSVFVNLKETMRKKEAFRRLRENVFGSTVKT